MSAMPQSEGESPRNTAMKQSDLSDVLRRERDRFVAFAFASADMLLELDAGGLIVFADGATKGLLGRSTDDLLGEDFLTLLHEDEREAIRQGLDDLDFRYRLEKADVNLLNRHGDAVPFVISGFRLSHIHKHTYLSLSLLKGDVTTDQIFKRDIDTGLLKTGGYVEAANEKIRAAKEKGEEPQVTLLDFPQLTAFLDALPPDQAEALLHEISAYLREHSLAGDTAGMINEEAFSFVHDASHEPGKVLSDLISLTQKFDPAGKGIEVRAKTVEADIGELSAQDSANVLLYTLNAFAQNAGEDFNIHSLSESYERLLDDTVEKIATFKQTVKDEDFDLAFQPIVDLKSGLIHHYEVLVRMKNPDVFKNPFEFIDFGEKSGVISDFDLVMVQKAFEVLKKTAKKGNYPIIAVNLSGRSLSSFLFRDALKKIVAMHTKLRKQVIFEVTESAKIDDMKSANDFIQELRQGGNLCCLDDFGTGESSFDYLRNLQVDFIKIDGSYVRESLQTQRGRHMLKAMSGLCRDLNVTTIGEMVEDEKAAALLWEAGVKFGQGYLFGKPEVDEETIINCKKPTPFYGGVMRAKKVAHTPKSPWEE